MLAIRESKISVISECCFVKLTRIFWLLKATVKCAKMKML